MPKSVLVVDDEARIRRVIRSYLQAEGLDVLEAGDGKQALTLLDTADVDLIVLDLMMPVMDGASFIREARRRCDVYIIVLTAITDEDEQVNAYLAGADDYVEKPFRCRTLTAKIVSVLARLDQQTSDRGVEQVAGIVVDEDARRVRVDHAPVLFKPKEFDLLCFLMRNRGLVLSRGQLLDNVWGADYDGSDRTVDIHVSNVRKKLGTYRSWVRTVAGRGYTFEDPDE